MSAASAPIGPVGNVYEKYGTRNPIARMLMRGFLDTVTDLYRAQAPTTVLEVGCGEGLLAAQLVSARRPERFEACDLTLDRLAEGLDPLIEFREASIYELPHADGAFDMVVCCEVLEHLDRPGDGLRELARVARRAVLVSTPREPLWRVLNVARLRYLGDLGNTPGHVQHFSRRALVNLVGSTLDIREVRTPVPWTVVLAAPRP